MSVFWPDFTVNGCKYGLAHLQPFTVSVTPKSEGAPTYKVYVSFGLHTFSTEVDQNTPLESQIAHRGDVRCFCPIRHGLSLYLPSIIRNGVSGRAYFSQRNNHMLIHDLPGLAGPYAVFFNVQKAKSKEFDAAMFVVSAYEKPKLPSRGKLPAITFATLIAKTVRGEPILRPKK